MHHNAHRFSVEWARVEPEPGWFDRAIIFWDIPTGKQVRSLLAPNSIGALTFSPDGKTITIQESDGAQRDFDLQTGKELSARPAKRSR